jgi:hypothetical protein
MADGILAKSGKDSIDVAGHKIPIALIGAVVAVVGVVLFMRARSQGSSAAVGAVPSANTGVNPVVDLAGQASTDAAQLANLNQQLVGISQQINAPASSAPAIPQINTANWTQKGSGFVYNQGSGGVSEGGMNFFQLSAPGAAAAYSPYDPKVGWTGGTQYLASAPGVFTPIVPGTPTAPGTVIYGAAPIAGGAAFPSI